MIFSERLCLKSILSGVDRGMCTLSDTPMAGGVCFCETEDWTESVGVRIDVFRM